MSISRYCFARAGRAGLAAALLGAAALALAAEPPRAADEIALTVDASAPLQPISPLIYGVNLASWAETYYLDQVTPYLKDANVTVVRLGATAFERYNYQTNRNFDVVTQQNVTVPLAWASFVRWCRTKLKAEPFLQASVYGNVAGEGDGVADLDYSRAQTLAEVTAWVKAAKQVRYWGVGNEPFLAWRRVDYPTIFHDDAHGDQVMNHHTSYAHYFSRFTVVAHAIKSGRSAARVLGPTPANWWLYWTNDYSPQCPVQEPGEDPQVDDPAWATMADAANQWNNAVYPDRGGHPDLVGWEDDPQKVLPQYLQRMQDYQGETRKRLADFLDVHRYLRGLTDFDAVQEPRGLWQADFVTRDQEIREPGLAPNLLPRLQRAIDLYYPGTALSLSEYDYFYWSGTPSIAQLAAIGQMDFLGAFGRTGVQLACNWYVGEPDQSGGGRGLKGKDSAGQAMFDEHGDPNPKYWAFRLMSHHYRGTALTAESSDWDRFSIHVAQLKKQLAVIVAYKGEYDAEGHYLPGPARQAELTLNGLAEAKLRNLKLRALYRFGRHDPRIMTLAADEVAFDGTTLSYKFEPLALYAFIFSSQSKQLGPATLLEVSPREVALSSWDGAAPPAADDLSHAIRITNVQPGVTTWSATTPATWLTITPTVGAAAVTDLIRLTADSTGLSAGVYTTTISVFTQAGSVGIPVQYDVLPGDAGGERRLADFETGSLVHAWNEFEPYSVGWWAGHGGPEDREAPYIYTFTHATDNVSRLGGQSALRVDYNRANGDTLGGKDFLPFGTFGHQAALIEDGEGGSVLADATSNWSGFVTLEFDVFCRTTKGGDKTNHTELQLVIGDEDGRRGKAIAWDIANHTANMRILDGRWWTVQVPLDRFHFYDWSYPDGQDGSLVELDFTRISQLEFVPWPRNRKAVGYLYVDNVRLVRDSVDYRRAPYIYPYQEKQIVRRNEPVQLSVGNSFDPDGFVARYRWEPATYLTNATSWAPVFRSSVKGEHVINLIAIDDDGLESRNVNEVRILVK